MTCLMDELYSNSTCSHFTRSLGHVWYACSLLLRHAFIIRIIHPFRYYLSLTQSIIFYLNFRLMYEKVTHFDLLWENYSLRYPILNFPIKSFQSSRNTNKKTKCKWILNVLRSVSLRAFYNIPQSILQYGSNNIIAFKSPPSHIFK